MAETSYTKQASAYTPIKGSGYVSLPLVPYLVGIGAILLPLPLLAKRPGWVNSYIVLIALMLVVYYWKPLNRFSQYVATQRSALVKGK